MWLYIFMQISKSYWTCTWKIFKNAVYTYAFILFSSLWESHEFLKSITVMYSMFYQGSRNDFLLGLRSETSSDHARMSFFVYVQWTIKIEWHPSVVGWCFWTQPWSHESWNFATHLSKRLLCYYEESSWRKYHCKYHRQQRASIVAGSFSCCLYHSQRIHVFYGGFLCYKARHQFSFAFISPSFCPFSFSFLHNPLHLFVDILLRPLLHGLMIFYLALSSIFSSLTRSLLHVWKSSKKNDKIISSTDSELHNGFWNNSRFSLWTILCKLWLN